jgi:hypothetical protein
LVLTAFSDRSPQIQFLLGHVSIQTTERYLGCKQKLRCAVNDRSGAVVRWTRWIGHAPVQPALANP